MKITDVVKKQVKNVALYNLALTAVLNAVFAIAGYWEFSVLLGSLFGYVVSVVNFLFLGISVQKAMDKDQKQAQTYMQSTYMGRMAFTAIMVVVAMNLPVFNWLSAVIPLVFTRVSIMVMNFTKKEE